MTTHPVVLYVEDDPRSRMVMEMLLSEDMGLPYLTIFEDSQDFIPRVEALDPIPDLIFLDIHMTPIDGFQMLALLRGHPGFAHLPVIALTASVMNEEVDQLRHAGFNGVIAKPINLESFPETLGSILSGESIWMIVR